MLVAIDPAEPSVAQGYAAYRTPRNEVVLAHLVVRPEARGQQIARSIVGRLSEKFPDRRGIGAKCRPDFPADPFWPRLGFVALGSLVGRSQEAHLLTYWWRDHGHADLMTWSGPPPSAFPVVMDANVFIDLHGAKPGSLSPSTRRLLLEVLGDRIELLVTPEMYNEMARVADPAERRRLRNIIASQYPRLPVHADRFESIREVFVRSLGKEPASTQDQSDLNHIAYASAAGVSTVVTRDNPVLRHLRSVAAADIGVDVVSPEELVAHIDESEAVSAYRPAALLGTGYSLKEAGTGDDSQLREFFSYASGERLRDYEQRLRALAGTRPSSSRLLLADPTGTPIALLGTLPLGDVLSVPVARMNQTALQATLAAQMASLLRTCASDAGARAIRITDPHAHPVLIDALLRDGFQMNAAGALAISVPRLCTLNELEAVVTGAVSDPSISGDEADSWLKSARRLASEPSARAALSLERQLRPMCIVDAPVDSWLVPIRPQFSAQLFGYPQELLARRDGLGISVEHVYYRGGRSGEAGPSRVLWYVSGAREGVVMGRSELIEVVDGPWETVFRDFRRLGVYTRGDVRSVADGRGQVRALRVVNTEVFPRPLPLRNLRRFAEGLGHSLQLRSPSRIRPDLFASIMKEVSL
ncbi:GNAT family N-acetyltransferase [Pengzhenrongella frigida]|uniref:GNAT family N-acetyltransferase n=1 Tax=Pengzhenrongella frigida TaxID=1259133 RepID=UPI0033130497